MGGCPGRGEVDARATHDSSGVAAGGSGDGTDGIGSVSVGGDGCFSPSVIT